VALAVLGLALYLWVLAKRGKNLQATNAPLARRRIYGLVAALPMLIVPLFYGGNLIMFAWCVPCGVLGYITVAHAPPWIVGGARDQAAALLCAGCGNYSDPSAKFCPSCGKPLTEQS
jgi:hypothetical protein